MNNLITPYDLGNSQLVEHTQSVNINNLVRQAQKDLKLRLLEAHVEALGLTLTFTTSKVGFGGQRIWFVCPICKERKGVIYTQSGLIGCRSCLGLKYKKQRFKGMIESENRN